MPKIYSRICDQCGKIYKGQGKYFCSKECQHKSEFSKSENIKLKCKIATCNKYKRPLDDIQRFWSYVDIRGFFDCWEWQGGVNDSGYGVFKANGKQIRANRFAYELYHGKIPEGKQANHKCNNHPCCNPFHLYAGTAKDNMNDRDDAGRQARGESQGCHKLTEKQIIEIRANRSRKTQTELAERYNVHQGNISLILNNKAWTHVS